MKNITLYLLNEKKTEFIPPSEMGWPKSGFLLIIFWWGESDKAILNESMKLYYLQCKHFQLVVSMLFGQVSLAVFFGPRGNIFRTKKKEKLAHTPMLLLFRQIAIVWEHWCNLSLPRSSCWQPEVCRIGISILWVTVLTVLVFPVRLSYLLIFLVIHWRHFLWACRDRKLYYYR